MNTRIKASLLSKNCEIGLYFEKFLENMTHIGKQGLVGYRSGNYYCNT